MEKQNNQGKLLVQLGVKKTDIKIVTFSKIQYNPFFIVNVTVYDNWNFEELIRRTYYLVKNKLLPIFRTFREITFFMLCN
jgi:hypothetical protein